MNTTPATISSFASSAYERLPAPVVDLLDDTTATATLRRAGLAITHAQPDYIRHKSGETSIISYRFALPGSDAAGLGYAQWCQRSERADEIYDKALTLRPRPSSVGVSTIRVDAHTVFYGFPNDARLRRLRWFSTDRKLHRAFASLARPGEQLLGAASTSTVLKYKPERRMVARIDLATSRETRRLLIRYTTTRSARHLAATATALLDHGVQTPAPIAQLDDARVGVDTFIDGVELQTWIRNGDAIAAELATAMRSFHRTPPLTTTPDRRPSDDLANAIDGLATLSIWNRILADLARSVAGFLIATEPPAPDHLSLIHGDLHDKNVLVNDAGVWFVDLERTAAGSVASDLGRLRAHAISLGIRQPAWSPNSLDHADAVIDHYRFGGEHGRVSAIDDHSIAWHCAIALVDQALLVTRHVERGWEANADALLESAIAELRGAHARRRGPRTGVVTTLGAT